MGPHGRYCTFCGRKTLPEPKRLSGRAMGRAMVGYWILSGLLLLPLIVFVRLFDGRPSVWLILIIGLVYAKVTAWLVLRRVFLERVACRFCGARCSRHRHRGGDVAFDDAERQAATRRLNEIKRRLAEIQARPASRQPLTLVDEEPALLEELQMIETDLARSRLQPPSARVT